MQKQKTIFIYRRLFAQGQALVEFALILPVLVLILLGVFDLGRAIFANTAVSNTAREAARSAIAGASSTAIQTRVQQTAVGIYSTDGSVFGYAISPSPPIAYGGTVNVTVSYTFTAATPFIGQYLGSNGQIVISSQASMTSQ